MVDAISNLLMEKGHTVIPYIRTSLDIRNMKFGKSRAFFSGIYNRKAKRSFSVLLRRERPDAVFVQNLFPLISPSILPVCREKNIPVVMRCPNYRLICPNGLFLRKGNVCELCSHGHEYNCLIHNCEKNIFKSAGYALRNYIARKFFFYRNNVDIFMVLTEFAKNKFIENGFPEKKIRVIYGLANVSQFKPDAVENDGDYIGFAGRLSKEKGIDILIKAAAMLSHIPFKIAGEYKEAESMVKSAPGNMEFLGRLSGETLTDFYKYSRIIALPSKCYEGLPAVVIEAMLSAKPVICSDLGGLPEIVDNEKTGLLFKPDNVEDFADKILQLWNNPERCRQYGNAARKKAEEEYHPDTFYKRLMDGFRDALARRNS